MSDDEKKSLIDLFDSIVDMQKTNPDAVELFIKDEIEREIIRVADGDEESLLRLRQFQWGLNKELHKIKNPTARMNKMAELFWTGVKKFENACKGTFS
jgi:hypothetical protein